MRCGDPLDNRKSTCFRKAQLAADMRVDMDA
jgi:hypothetical protein